MVAKLAGLGNCTKLFTNKTTKATTMSLLLSRRRFLSFFPFAFAFFFGPRKTTHIKKYALGVIAPRLVFIPRTGKFGRILL